MKLGVITNPNARNNRSRGDRLRELEGLVGDHGLVRQTPSLEALGAVTNELVAAGVDCWVSDGGDGAFHWMVNAVFEARARAGVNPSAPLWFAPTNAGTVNFIARKARLTRNADDILRRLIAHARAGADPPVLHLDTLRLRARHPDHPAESFPFQRLGFGTAIGGVGQRFFANYYEQSVQGPGGIALLALKSAVGLAADVPGLRRLPLAPATWRRYGTGALRPTRARVVADGHAFPYREMHGLHAGSFTTDLGPVELFPYADEPGKLHFAVGRTRLREVLPGLFDIVRGRPVRGAEWHELAGERLEVWVDGAELLRPYLDGEALPEFEAVEITVGPSIAVIREP